MAVLKHAKALESSVLRKDLEDVAFGAWQKAEGDARIAQEVVLRELLMNHAQAVMYQILRRSDQSLVTEAADKVMLNLGTFRGDSLFTTWAHRILMGVMYDQRRLDRRRKETSMDVPGFDLAGEPSIGMSDVLLTVQKLLTDEDYRVFEQIVLVGRNHGEAAAHLNVAKATLTRQWDRIKRTLANAFTK